MPSGHVLSLYLFEIGDAVDLPALGTLVGSSVAAPLTSRPSNPPSLQYQQPPVIVDVATIGLGAAGAQRIRLTVYDYGVISVGFTEPLPPSWEQMIELGPRWQDNPRIVADAERCCRELVRRIGSAITAPRSTYLWEDYVIYVITRPEDGAADALLAARGPAIAQLLRGERETLSAQERDEVLRHRISYYASDIVIATWSSALVYDSEAGAQSSVEILEFANSQLLQFRYYDQLLDGELARIYAQLQQDGWRQNWAGRRYTRAARHVHSLFIDVNELTDRTENALKIAGDVYVARLFATTAARLGLEQWRGNVREKLKTLDDIYRFAVEHAAMSRGELLELTVVILILLELVLLLVTGMH